MPNNVEQSQRFNRQHRISENERIEYGYRDGGRGLRFNDDGSPANMPSREIIVVRSPDQDPALRQAIETARRDMAGMTSIEERANYLNEYVGRLMHQNDPDLNERIMDRMFGGDARGREISLGQLIESGTGVCRHRSLLFKTMADELGIPAAIVRGNYYSPGGGGGGHAWNEIRLENGDRMIVDVMHDFVGRIGNDSLGASGHPKALHYTFVDDTPMYDEAGKALLRDVHLHEVSNPKDPSAGLRIVGEADWQEIEKGGLPGLEVNVNAMPSAERRAIMQELSSNGIRAEIVSSSVQNYQSVIRVLGEGEVGAIQGAIDAVADGRISPIAPDRPVPVSDPNAGLRMVGEADWGRIEKGGVLGIEVNVNNWLAPQRQAMLDELASKGIQATVVSSSVQNEQYVIRAMGSQEVDAIEGAVDALRSGQVPSAPQRTIDTSPIRDARWMEVGDRSGNPALYASINGMNANQQADLEASLRAQGIEYEIKHSSINGGTDVIAISDPSARSLVQDIRDGGPSIDGHSRVASTSSDAASMAGSAKRGADALEASADALKLGARGMRLAKMGVVTTIAATAGAVVLTEKAHAAQIDLVDQYYAEGRFGDLNDPEQAEKARVAVEAYKEMNTEVRDMVIAETTVNQTPIVGVIIGMAATEAVSRQKFDNWLELHGPIDEDMYQALKMDMLGGSSLKAQFAMAGAEMIPATMSAFPVELQGLWEAKQRMDHAQSRSRVSNRPIRTRDADQRATAEAARAENNAAYSDAKAEYQAEFDRLMSDPSTATQMLELMPQELLLEMVVETARSNADANHHPAIQRMAEIQEQLDVMRNTLGNAQERTQLQDELKDIKQQFEENPELMYGYIREVFGGQPPQEYTAPTVEAVLVSYDADQTVEAEAGAFGSLSEDAQNQVIDDLTRKAGLSESLRNEHPYIRELAEVTKRIGELERSAGNDRYARKHGIAGKLSDANERLETIREELRENPAILDEAAAKSEQVADIVNEHSQGSDISVPDGPFTHAAGELVADAAEAGVNVDPSATPDQAPMQTAVVNDPSLSTPQV